MAGLIPQLTKLRKDCGFTPPVAQAELLKLQFTSQVKDVASAVTGMRACREGGRWSRRGVMMQKQQKRRKANTDYFISVFATQNFIILRKHILN